MPNLHINGSTKKVACGPCIRGHRSTHCHHWDRALIEIRRSGRPLVQCPHPDDDDCQCHITEMVYVVVGHKPEWNGPEGEISNAEFTGKTVEYPKANQRGSYRGTLPPIVPSIEQEQSVIPSTEDSPNEEAVMPSTEDSPNEEAVMESIEDSPNEEERSEIQSAEERSEALSAEESSETISLEDTPPKTDKAPVTAQHSNTNAEETESSSFQNTPTKKRPQTETVATLEAADDMTSQPPPNGNRDRLRLGLMGVGGARAGPDPIGWDGNWPSRDKNSPEDSTIAPPTKRQCCHKSKEHFHRKQAADSDQPKKKTPPHHHHHRIVPHHHHHHSHAHHHHPKRANDAVNASGEGPADTVGVLQPSIDNETATSSAEPSVNPSPNEELEDDFNLPFTDTEYPISTSAMFPQFNYLTPIPEANALQQASYMQTDNQGQAFPVSHFETNEPYGVPHNHGPFNFSTPAVSDGCICAPEECGCLNCAQHVNNPYQQQYFKYFWDLQASPSWIAEEERINQSGVEHGAYYGPNQEYHAGKPSHDTSNTQQSSLPLEPASLETTLLNTEHPSSSEKHSLDTTRTPLADASNTMPGVIVPVTDGTSDASNTGFFGPANYHNLDIAASLRSMADLAFPQEPIHLKATSTHGELTLRPIPNAHGVVLDPEHVSDVRVKLYHEGLVIEDALGNRAQVVRGKLLDAVKTSNGGWSYPAPILHADENGEPPLQKVKTGLFRFSPSLDDPGLSKEMADKLRIE